MWVGNVASSNKIILPTVLFIGVLSQFSLEFFMLKDQQCSKAPTDTDAYQVYWIRVGVCQSDNTPLKNCSLSKKFPVSGNILVLIANSPIPAIPGDNANTGGGLRFEAPNEKASEDNQFIMA